MIKPSVRLQSLLLLLLLLLLQNAPGVSAQDEPTKPPSYKTVEFWGQIAVILLLVVVSGIVAGLTLGLMSQDTTHLAILSAAGTPKQKDYASRIIPIRKKGHLLLTALLLTNTVLNETLPVLCDELFGKGFVAVIISTVLIVIFAEIIPQAVCSRHGLAIGAIFALPVKLLMGFWFIIAWPISKALDCLLGPHQGLMYTVPELRALIGLHSQVAPTYQSVDPDMTPGMIAAETVTLLQNTLDVSQKTAGQLALPYSQIDMLHADTLLDKDTIVKLMLRCGPYGIPVYEDQCGDPPHQKRRIIGVLKVQHLSTVDPEECIPIRKISLSPIRHVLSTLPAVTLLKLLYTDRNQLVLVDDISAQDSVVNEKEVAVTTVQTKPSLEHVFPATSPSLGIVTFQELAYQLLYKQSNCNESELGNLTITTTGETTVSSTNLPDTPSVPGEPQSKENTKICIEDCRRRPKDSGSSFESSCDCTALD